MISPQSPSRFLHIVTTFFRVRKVANAINPYVDPTTASLQPTNNIKELQDRQEEYWWCIRQNLFHPAVAGVHLLVQDDDSMRHLTQHPHYPMLKSTSRLSTHLFDRSPTQPLYSDIFRFANNSVPSGSLCMVCNADIYVDGADVPRKEEFDRIILLLDGQQQKRKRALAMTRWESKTDAPLIHDYRGSHDAFVFRNPLPETFIRTVQHPQNCYKAENIVVHEFERSGGYELFNPCLDFRIYHKHATAFRQWLAPVDEDRYGRVQPCAMHDIRERK